MMVYADQGSGKAINYLVQILKRQVALVQLSIGEFVIYNLSHQSLDARRGRIRNGPGSGLDAVGQVNYARLLGLRLRPGLPVVPLFDLLNRWVLLFLRLIIKISD